MKLLIYFMLIVSLISSGWCDKIVLASDEWMPYSGKEGTGKQGFMVEVAIKALSLSGHKVVYMNMPWARAVEESRRGNLQAIVGAYKSDVPGFVFPEEPLGISQNLFYVRNDDDWKYEGVKSLKGRRLGIIKDYSYGDELDKYILSKSDRRDAVQPTTGDEGLKQNVLKLLMKRIDLVIEDSAVMSQFLSNNKSLNKIKVASEAMQAEYTYIAFSPKSPKSKEYAKALSRGIRAMRKDGSLARILRKYGVKDWKKVPKDKE